MSAACDGRVSGTGATAAGKRKPPRGQRVDGGRGVAAGDPAQRVGPQGVHGDEQDVGARVRGRLRGRRGDVRAAGEEDAGRDRDTIRTTGGLAAAPAACAVRHQRSESSSAPRLGRLGRPAVARRALEVRPRRRGLSLLREQAAEVQRGGRGVEPGLDRLLVARDGVRGPAGLLRRLAPHPPRGREFGQERRGLRAVLLRGGNGRPRPARPGPAARRRSRSACPRDRAVEDRALVRRLARALRQRGQPHPACDARGFRVSDELELLASVLGTPGLEVGLGQVQVQEVEARVERDRVLQGGDAGVAASQAGCASARRERKGTLPGFAAPGPRRRPPPRGRGRRGAAPWRGRTPSAARRRPWGRWCRCASPLAPE